MAEQKRSKKRRQVRRYVTLSTVARFEAAVIAHGNGAAAVRAIEPDENDASRRAWLIRQRAKGLDSTEYIDGQMQQGGIEAVERVRLMVQSADERIATRNSHFIIDHVRGKALQRSESKHLNLNIEAVLE